jgi:hypothetical protein
MRFGGLEHHGVALDQAALVPRLARACPSRASSCAARALSPSRPYTTSTNACSTALSRSAIGWVTGLLVVPDGCQTNFLELRILRCADGQASHYPVRLPLRADRRLQPGSPHRRPAGAVVHVAGTAPVWPGRDRGPRPARAGAQVLGDRARRACRGWAAMRPAWCAPVPSSPTAAARTPRRRRTVSCSPTSAPPAPCSSSPGCSIPAGSRGRARRLPRR